MLAIDIDPDFAIACNNLGATLQKMGRHQEALEEYREAIRIDPNYKVAKNNIRALHIKLGQYFDASLYK